MTPSPVSVPLGEPATRVRAILREQRFRSLPVVDEEGRVVGTVTVKDMLRITSTRSNLPVEGLMSPVLVHLLPEEPLRQGVEKLVEAGESRGVVVNSPSEMKLLGIFSLHDFLRALRGEGDRVLEARVEEVMDREVVTCSPKDTVARVWRLMEEAEVSLVPVVSRRLVGVVTRRDILAAGHARIRIEDEKGPRRVLVERVMRSPPVVVEPGDTLGRAVDLMLEKGVGRLPVVNAGRPVGLVGRFEVAERWLA
jgi:CBS domain-containing protein